MNEKYLRIVFLGTPDFAVASLKALIDNGFNVVGVVTAPDKPAGRGQKMHESAVKAYASGLDIPLLQPEKLRSRDFQQKLKAWNADIQVVVAFRMLPESVWNMPPMGTVNVHASLLPQYRGAAPINWAIINGEKETGVTTFLLQHEIDTGNILLQKRVGIEEKDNIGSLYEKLMQAGAELLVETIGGLATHDIQPVPQEESGLLKHAPKIFKEDCLIDWNQKAEAVHNLVRGLSPYPGAFTYLEDKVLKIFESAFKIVDTGRDPGTIETDNKKYLRYYAADGYVECLSLQLEGKKRMHVEDFLRGYTFK